MASESSDPPEKKVLHFEDVMLLAGGSGRWQVMFFCWILLIITTFGYQLMAVAFMGETPGYLCADGYPKNVTFASLLEAGAEQCLAPDGQPCRRWTYDPAFSGSSLVTQWDLVCTRRSLLSTTQAVLQFGCLFGTLLGAFVGDKLGRRVLQHVMISVYLTGALLAAVPYQYELLLVARFIMGIGLAASLNINTIMILELIEQRWRVWAGLLITAGLPLGEILLAAVAYKLRVWWQLQLALSAPMVMFLFSFWVVPESPRWLLVQGRDAELLRVLRTIARVNGSKLPEEALLNKMLADVRQHELVTTETVSETSQLWRSPRLRRWMLATCFIRATYNVSYYGLSFDMTQLSKSRYVAGVLSGLVAIPGSFISPLVNRLGRRHITSGTLLLTGVSMLLVLIDDDDATLMLAAGLAGKMFASATQNMSRLYTPEYIPTSVRAVGYGLTCVSTRVGSMIAPYIVELAGDIHHTAPSLIIGALSLLAGLVVLLLPETTNRPMPQTVAQVEAGLLDKPVTDSKSLGSLDSNLNAAEKPIHVNGVDHSGAPTVTAVADAVSVIAHEAMVEEVRRL